MHDTYIPFMEIAMTSLRAADGIAPVTCTGGDEEVAGANRDI